MKHNTKHKINKFLLKITKPDMIQLLFLFFILCIPTYKLLYTNESFDIMSVFSISTFTGFFLAYTASGLANNISKVLNRKLEDHLKLNSDYSLLVKKYPFCEKMIRYKNSDESNYVKGRKFTSAMRIKNQLDYVEDEYIFPVTIEAYCNGRKFDIFDSTHQYTLPHRIMEHYDEIMSAHGQSDVYNQLNIRLDGYIISDKIILNTSRTTYYDSLVTNRAMDFKWKSNISIRDIYGPGPFLKVLEESELSNHLGFNGFVETSDNKIIFVKRYNNVSIGKGTLGDSIGASLKAKYALNKTNGKFTLDGLINGIKSEIKDELKIGRECYEFSLEDNIISIYRDIVEGGKPQLLFYVKLKIDFNEVEKTFFTVLKNENKSKDKVKKLNADGKELICVDRMQLSKLYITPDAIVIGDKAYNMMPSASASIIMLFEYFEKRGIEYGKNNRAKSSI